jgi:hypothetical protein
MKPTDPFELGEWDAKMGHKSQNPYPEFSTKWGLYNHGYNRVANPWMFKEA